MTNNTISPAKLIEYLQHLLNETAAAQNYELEAKTTGTFSLLQRIEQGLPTDETGLSSYYTLFNAWIRWLCDWDHYSLNLLHRRQLTGLLNKRLGQDKFDLQIYPYNSKLYSMKKEKQKLIIQMHEALDYMSEAECQKFAQYAAGSKWNLLHQLIRDYQTNTPRYMELVNFFRETKVDRMPENNTRGKFYDLERVFQSCNQHNFGGKMPRPKGIHWSQRINHSTMGSYNLKEDTVMINRGLDRSDVPAYVLDFIMYHELLHKLLGVETSGNRHRSHTPEFRKLEQAHPQYQQAQAFIQKNASRL